MSNSHTSLMILLQLLCISSCSITIQYPPTPQISNTSTVNIMPDTITKSDEKKNNIDITIPTLNNGIDKSLFQIDTAVKSTIKVTLCSPFVPPVIPEVPRVDLIKLSAISENDHNAVNNLLVDNIRAVNDHSKKVEELLRVAIINHRKTCTQREIIDKK